MSKTKNRKKPKKKPRKIRDTDIIYSAISDDGGVCRFSLHPTLDDKPYGHPSTLKNRAVYIRPLSVFVSKTVFASCRSPEPPSSVYSDFMSRLWTKSDGWLDWLAEGEEDR